jgi:hypothetical protein
LYQLVVTLPKEGKASIVTINVTGVLADKILQSKYGLGDERKKNGSLA